MDQYSVRDHSGQWDFFVKVAFAVAIVSAALGIYLLPGPLGVKAYFLLSVLVLFIGVSTVYKTCHSRRKWEKRAPREAQTHSRPSGSI